MKKILSLTLVLTLCLALLSGCGGSSAASTEAAGSDAAGPEAAAPAAAEPKTLNIALSGQPEHLDVAMSSMDIASEIVFISVFEKLVAFDSESRVIPELAESWELTDENRVYTYHLRHGVKFHNGEEMKAADVVASMNRWIDAAANARGLVGDARFTAVDDYTVEIRLETGTLYLNEMIAGLGQQAVIMPASVIGAVGAGELVQEYVGTGPYFYDEWKADQYIRLKAFDGYTPYGTQGDYSGWGGYKTAWYDEVYFYFPGDPGSVVAGVQTGEYDMCDQIGGDQYAAFEGDSAFTIFSAEAEEPMLIFNKATGVGADPVVRQAIQAVINCGDLLHAAYGSEDLYNLYSSYMFKDSATWYTEAGSDKYNQADPEAAKALFARAGWTDGDVFRILVNNSSSGYVAEALVIQEELRAIGVNCEVLSYDSATYSDVRNNHTENWDAFITGFGPKVLPNMNLYLSTGWPAEGTGCTDERVQGDLAAIASGADLATAQNTWAELQRYMYEEYVPVVKFGSTFLSGVSRSDITGAFIKERLVWIDARPAA